MASAKGKAKAGKTLKRQFYVSPDGNDAWSGTLKRPNKAKTDGPLATLEAARDAIRNLKKSCGLPKGGITVWISGTHLVRKSLALAKEDSGTPSAPIIYRSQRGKNGARLLGGQIIGGFTKVTDPAILQRLAPEARGKVLQTDLKAQGVTDFGKIVSRGFSRWNAIGGPSLFFDGKPMTLARWPNDGFEKIAGFPKESAIDDGYGEAVGRVEDGFYYHGDRPKRWQDIKDVWIHGYWSRDWALTYEKVESYDPKTGLFKMTPPHGLYSYRTGQRIFFLNILEELDQPGEWYLDRKSGILYFWPPAPLAKNEVAVSILEEPFITLEDVSHVTIQDIDFEYARGNAITMTGGTKNLIAGCTMRGIGNNAIVIDGGKEHGVVGCDLAYLEDGGVKIAGGDRKTLTPCGHYVLNNHIHDFTYFGKCSDPAIRARGVGMRIAHNVMHHSPYIAIMFTGNDFVIEFNEIYSVCLETGDSGGIYTGRDWTFRGNVIRHNFLHHMGGVGLGSFAVYMDDCVSGANIFGNVFYKTQCAVFLGGGRDHRVENNIFVDCHPAVRFDGRGLDPGPVWHTMIYETMKKWLEDMQHHRPPYSRRWPELADLDKYYKDDKGVPPENNSVIRNLCAGGQWMLCYWGATEDMLDIRDNLITDNPGFTDPRRMNFQLKGNSPVYKLGFKRVPVEKIGLYKDKYRTDIPKREREPVTK